MLKSVAKSFSRIMCSLNLRPTNVMQVCGIKHYPPPPSYEHVEFPERTRLKFLEKVPQYPGNLKPPKMMKLLKLIRGPETLHNTLLHKQYGIVARGGGRLRWEHLEMIRLGIIRKIDASRMFAIWRVDAPWQSVTKKGQGQRMGGGKGPIDHYVTPVKSGRIIIELGGHCEFAEVFDILDKIARKLPFKAEAISQQLLEDKIREEKRLQRENRNPYTFQYIIQNNMGGCHSWIKPVDKIWFGKYL